jgi:hypothetical protein
LENCSELIEIIDSLDLHAPIRYGLLGPYFIELIELSSINIVTVEK